MRRKILLSPDPAEGGEKPTDTTGEKPPAADLVSKSKAGEEEAGEIVRRRRELEDREKKIKDRETALAEKEDKARREKEAAEAESRNKATKEKNSWLNGVF